MTGKKLIGFIAGFLISFFLFKIFGTWSLVFALAIAFFLILAR